MTAKRIAKDALLGLAGLAGLACILWLLASTLLGASLVIFRTGSMAPTMPTGTAAIAVPVAGEDVAPGDVLMVAQEGGLPVTHRVVTVEPDSGVAGGVVLELRGDANTVSDPEEYRVTEAMRIVLPFPGLGTAVELARTPLFLGAATLLVAGLVVWAFWPKPEEEAPQATEEPTIMRDRFSEVNQ